MSPRRKSELETLYREIHDFAASRDRGDTPLTPRRVDLRALDSELIILGQGLANSTQRVTGYPWRSPQGLSQAGQRLDKFLKPIGYTIDHTDKSRTYAYSTDLVPWYPGKNSSSKRDLRPTSDEIALCWQWFERECALVQPRAIILLGQWAADQYRRQYSREPRLRSLQDCAGRPFESAVCDHKMTAVAAYHPSAVWGSLEKKGRTAWRRVVRALKPILANDAPMTTVGAAQ